MMVASTLDWNTIILALIAALPGIIAAFYAGRIHKQIKTPSGNPIGTQVEDVLHTALVNNGHLRSIGDKVKASIVSADYREAWQPPEPPKADDDATTTTGSG